MKNMLGEIINWIKFAKKYNIDGIVRLNTFIIKNKKIDLFIIYFVIYNYYVLYQMGNIDNILFDNIIDKIRDNKLDEINRYIFNFIDGKSENLKKLCNVLNSNTSVQRIYFYNWNLSDRVKYISDILKENSNIKTLDLVGANIGELGVKYISESLMGNSSLIELNLKYNNIDNIGAKYIKNALIKNSSLTALHLAYNNIGNEGVKYISESLMENSSLTYLDLTRNILSDDGTKYISDILKKNSSLTVLDISCNNITIDGLKNISNVLKENSVLG